MTYTQKIVIRILLLVAKMISDQAWRDEIQKLSDHIKTFLPEVKEVA